ncbi:MAG: DUF1573 domain-containing protein [Flavobacteriales bacterium]
MKDKIQIALLAVIAVALVAIAVNQFTGDDSGEHAASSMPAKSGDLSSASRSIVADPGTAANTFDPMAQSAEKVDNTPKTTVTFAKYEHDFGNVKQDSENKYTFTFTNTGKEPMIIETANGSCGCTVPQYPKEPIPPGGTGDILVEYKPGKQENAQTKTVTVIANTEPRETTLRIKANVQKVG